MQISLIDDVKLEDDKGFFQTLYEKYCFKYDFEKVKLDCELFFKDMKYDDIKDEMIKCINFITKQINDNEYTKEIIIDKLYLMNNDLDILQTTSCRHCNSDYFVNGMINKMKKYVK
jgi:hypothetical protein